MSTSLTPIYLRIATQLRARIQQRQYAAGDKLPAEGQLAAEFGVNRHTLRQAVSILKDEGLVEIRRGLGTFVMAAPIRYAIGKRVRFNQLLKAQTQSSRFEIIKAEATRAAGAIAENMALVEGADVAHIERLSYADDVPISVGSGFFPLGLFPDLLSEESLSQLQSLRSISQWLRDRYEVDHQRQSTTVSARLVQPGDAKLLRLAKNQPILLAESVNVDQHGRKIEYGIARLRGDRMELFFENA